MPRPHSRQSLLLAGIKTARADSFAGLSCTHAHTHTRAACTKATQSSHASRTHTRRIESTNTNTCARTNTHANTHARAHVQTGSDGGHVVFRLQLKTLEPLLGLQRTHTHLNAFIKNTVENLWQRM